MLSQYILLIEKSKEIEELVQNNSPIFYQPEVKESLKMEEINLKKKRNYRNELPKNICTKDEKHVERLGSVMEKRKRGMILKRLKDLKEGQRKRRDKEEKYRKKERGGNNKKKINNKC